MNFPLLSASIVVFASVLLVSEPAMPTIACSLICVPFCYLSGVRMRRKQPDGRARLFFSAAAVLALSTSSVISVAAYRTLQSEGIARYADAAATVNAAASASIGVRARIRHIAVRTKTQSAILDHLEIVVADGSVPVRGRLSVTLFTADIPLFPTGTRAGALVELTGHIRPLPQKSNPFDFDEAAYLRSLQIDAVFETTSDPIIIDPIGGADPSSRMIRLQARLTDDIRRVHTSEAAKQLMPAMLLGQRQYMNSEIKNAFRLSGLSHVLAISGLHAGILAFALFWTLGALLSRTPLALDSRRVIRTVVTVTALLFYMVLAGSSASVVRASVMGVILLIGSPFERTGSGLNRVGLAALVIILLDPDSIVTPGFQLSFAAVFAILIHNRCGYRFRFFRSEQPYVAAMLRRVWSLLSISFWIFCITFPIVSFHFGTASSAGVLTNLAAIPLTTVLMISGLLSTIFSFIGTPFAAIFASSTDILCNGLVILVSRSASLSGGMQWTMMPGHVGNASLALVLLFLVAHSGRSSIRSLTAWSMLTLVAVTGLSITGIRDGNITFLDVDQGDAVVIRSPSDRCIVVDTGPGYASFLALLRHIRAVGCTVLDPVIISHDHLDHSGGLEYLIESDIVGSIIVPFSAATTDENGGWKEAARRKNVPVTGASTGDTIPVDAAVRLYVLSPEKSIDPVLSTNNTSLIIVLKTEQSSVLFTGDAERLQEKDLVIRFGRLLRSHVVKVAHHGSFTSSIQPLVDRVVIPDTTIAVISVGYNNRFGHPSPKVLARWEKGTQTVKITAHTGAVSFDIRDGSVFLSGDQF